jgi:hypothetical protein
MSENRMKPINALCGKNTESSNFKADVTECCHCALMSKLILNIFFSSFCNTEVCERLFLKQGLQRRKINIILGNFITHEFISLRGVILFKKRNS